MCAVCDRGLGSPSLVAQEKPSWVLYNFSSLLNMPCLSSSTSRRSLCGLECFAKHDAGLLATFVPSLANGTTRNRCCRVGVAALVVRKSCYTKAYPHVVSRGDAAFNNDGMRTVSFPLLLGASNAFCHTLRRHSGPSMLMQTCCCP